MFENTKNTQVKLSGEDERGEITCSLSLYLIYLRWCELFTTSRWFSQPTNCLSCYL